MKAKVVNNATPSVTEYALTMSVVDHKHITVFIRNLVQLIQWGYITIHAEHAVGDDHVAAITGILIGFDLRSQILGVSMGVTDDLRP